MPSLPERTRAYQNHHLDSTRWDGFRPRAGDVVIVTPYKSGTTWVQAIVAHLVFPDGNFPAQPWQLSPWLEQRTRPLEDIIAGLEAQCHRRFIKCHLASDALPFFEEVRYIRQPRSSRCGPFALEPLQYLCRRYLPAERDAGPRR
jgi:aryl sulfotransferase